MNYTESILSPKAILIKKHSSLLQNSSAMNLRSAFQSVINQVKEQSPALYWVVVAHFIFAVACIPAIMIDGRELMGINVWIKPLKFLISTGIYLFTFGYYTSLYSFSEKKKRWLNGIVTWTLLIETMIIVVQGGRGVQSHYNIHSAIDGILFAIMGIFIGLNVLIMLFYLIETIRTKMKTSKVIQWSILLGWIILIVGSWIGGQMISQMSHTVGVADGGPGLPLVNWSTIAGDLRIAHFFGLHGLQIIPLFAWFISKKWKTNSNNKIIAVTIFGLAYAGWIAFTFYQAKQGIALISL